MNSSYPSLDLQGWADGVTRAIIPVAEELAHFAEEHWPRSEASRFLEECQASLGGLEALLETTSFLTRNISPQEAAILCELLRGEAAWFHSRALTARCTFQRDELAVTLFVLRDAIEDLSTRLAVESLSRPQHTTRLPFADAS